MLFQLQLDFQDLENLESVAVRPRWKQLLLLEKEKLHLEIKAAEKAKEKAENPVKLIKVPTVKINSYGK